MTAGGSATWSCRNASSARPSRCTTPSSSARRGISQVAGLAALRMAPPGSNSRASSPRDASRNLRTPRRDAQTVQLSTSAGASRVPAHPRATSRQPRIRAAAAARGGSQHSARRQLAERRASPAHGVLRERTGYRRRFQSHRRLAQKIAAVIDTRRRLIGIDVEISASRCNGFGTFANHSGKVGRA